MGKTKSELLKALSSILFVFLRIFFFFGLPELGAYDMHAKGSCTFMYNCSVFVVVEIVATQKTNLALIYISSLQVCN